MKDMVEVLYYLRMANDQITPQEILEAALEDGVLPCPT